MFVSITQKEEDLISELPNHDQDKPSKPYEKLKSGRQYTINKTIGCFDLSRFNLSQEYKQFYYHNWEYFAVKEPILERKMIPFDVKSDPDNYKILFENDPNDDKYEAFYEKYGYEPDEQSLETQEKSILDIPEMEYKIWLDNCFPDTKPIIDISKKSKNDSIVKLVWQNIFLYNFQEFVL